MTVLKDDFVSDPTTMVDVTPTEMFSIPGADVEEMRRLALQKLFGELRPEVSVLDRLAKNQGLDAIDTVDDAVPLLFQHTVYKSYPISVLERGQFDRLTKWLDQLTAHDLSALDTSACTSIDDWLALLDNETPMRLLHTSGTGGKLSFVPRSETEASAFERSWYQHMQGFGDEPMIAFEGSGMPIVAFGYRYGYNATQRRLEALIDKVAGSDDLCVALYPVRLSADLLSLAGRLNAAEAKGERGRLEISPSLVARRDEFIRMQQERPLYARRFAQQLAERFKGRQVVMTGTIGAYLDVMFAGEELGIDKLFDPSSVITAGGGFKGRTDVPADWNERLCAFLGLPRIPYTYGMTELMSFLRSCPEGYYHLPPFLLPYVLDPDDGTPSPRTGVHTGRFAFVDLLASSYWGGFISGDEVTIHWDDPCPCRRTGAYLEPAIERYSVKRGGDDKISCARVADAHDKALEFLVASL